MPKFDTKSSQIGRTSLWPFSLTFGLAYSPLKTQLNLAVQVRSRYAVYNLPTDKRTDVWSRDFIIWKIHSGLWAVVWAGLLRAVFSCFWGQKRILIFFWKHYSVHTEKLHNSLFFLFKKKKILTPKTWKKHFFKGLKIWV